MFKLLKKIYYKIAIGCIYIVPIEEDMENTHSNYQTYPVKRQEKPLQELKEFLKSNN